MTISAKIILDSISVHGDRITTWELEYPRFIHGEIMTHRVFSRNAQSSRAVPVTKTLEVNAQKPVEPLVWGKNKSGMSSEEQLTDETLKEAQTYWNLAATHAFYHSKELSDIGLHKQWSNRITEPFSTIKVIVTATEWDNFFWLRDDPDAAQPEIVELARRMKKAYDEGKPQKLRVGNWHLPYIDGYWDLKGNQVFMDSHGEELTLDEALKISASCCAQISYRKLDDSKEKAIEIYNRLFSGPKPHLSPTEHQARVPETNTGSNSPLYWEEGITHMNKYRELWSGNLRGWIQYRQLL